MKLWIISQDSKRGYDTYDSAVVAAHTEEEARNINPGGGWNSSSRVWCRTPEQVIVNYLGTTDHDISGVVLASFNAG